MAVPDQRIVAEFVDAQAVAHLCRIASGHPDEITQAAISALPPILHVGSAVPYCRDEWGRVRSILGTWTTDVLIAHLRRRPGSWLPAGLSLPEHLCIFGLEGAFPARVPLTVDPTGRVLEANGFTPGNDALFSDDDTYFEAIAEWCVRRSANADSDDRERDNALTAARFAEAWRDAPEGPSGSAYEMEIRARRMGMVMGDTFARRVSWSQALVGSPAIQALNNLVAWWGVAVLMPSTFRFGLIELLFSETGLCAALLCASAASSNLKRAAAQRSESRLRFPFEGVAYACPEGEEPAASLDVNKLVETLAGTPVFTPITGHPDSHWEMLLSLRVAEVGSCDILPLPWPVAFRRVGSVGSILLRVADHATPSGPGHDLIRMYRVPEDTTYGELVKTASEVASLVARAWRALQ